MTNRHINGNQDMNVSHFCATTTLYKRKRSRAKQGYSSRSLGV